MSFQSTLINWYLTNKRDLPWRNTTDPYVIWLSEIILQQTRVEQGMPYFNKFLAAFPTIGDFAAATETQVLKLWQGLGYYSRGRNMLFTALQIQDEYEGTFPVKYEDLIRLKGVGEYTAAAISSFSSNESRAVLDGNVFRLLSRYFGIDTPINSTTGKKTFSNLAQSLIVGEQASLYNQAIMEFGALQCKPKSPNCDICPLNSDCYARLNAQVNVLPVKLKTLKKRIRYFNYLVAMKDDMVLVKRRGPGDIWQELYDFPLIETAQFYREVPETFFDLLKQNFGKDCNVTDLGQKKHLLTHQTIYVQFFALDNYIINFNQNADIKWVTLAAFDDLPQPKVITDFMSAYSVKK
ncbi:A/G-specific adenine glycosylase [Pedobacter sp. MC2016-24]|uniref:A/G-specific adenine glycosylase n=1 Tax=Pedobacter sp. MC2016-24 TaxID=2780090 RepID=UPI00187E2A7F|nr:A/G-specific adenine glycosylase [Pedobacter sp. MC2016-24]MBE9598783.1 A/G-specific adenine glycosylase [Pedobacter sp. MC2016-24]